MAVSTERGGSGEAATAAKRASAGDATTGGAETRDVHG